jgi:hypothetical protein
MYTMWSGMSFPNSYINRFTRLLTARDIEESPLALTAQGIGEGPSMSTAGDIGEDQAAGRATTGAAKRSPK